MSIQIDMLLCHKRVLAATLSRLWRDSSRITLLHVSSEPRASFTHLMLQQQIMWRDILCIVLMSSQCSVCPPPPALLPPPPPPPPPRLGMFYA